MDTDQPPIHYPHFGITVVDNGLVVDLEVDESTTITVIPPQGRPAPAVTAENYAIALDAIEQWCAGRPFRVARLVPSFADMMSNGKMTTIELEHL